MMENNKGFTLVELLVVVIIIGILAAAAVPRYFRAVERTRASEAAGLLSGIAAAQERYNQRTGGYTANADLLDVDLPTPQFFQNLAVTAALARLNKVAGSNTGFPTGCTAAYNVTITYPSTFATEPAACAFVLP